MSYYDDTDNPSASRRFVRLAMTRQLLEKDDEQSLIARWKNQKDERALHRLIEAHMRLVVGQASKFRNYGLPVGDLMQEGYLGLLHAAEKFDADRDVRFSTYATWWVKSYMQDYVLRNWSIVRTGTTSAQKALFFNLRRLRAKIEEKTGKELTDTGRVEIANTLQVSLKDVMDVEVRLQAADQSLSAMAGNDSDDSWQDYLADERPNPEQYIQEESATKRRQQWLRLALQALNPREQMIISRRRLQEDESVTLEQLGEELGVSKERVRQVENRALEKLRASIGAMAAKHNTAPKEVLFA